MIPRVADDDQPLHKNNFFLETFSHREAGMGLAALIRPASSRLLDWSSLQIVPTSFVDPSLAATQADMLYTVRLRGQESLAYVYVLLEHQSTQPRRMLNRMHGYITRIEEHHFKTYPEAEATPLVLPVILYQGKTDWSGPRRYLDTYHLDTEQQAELGHFIPNFVCEIISLPSLQLEALDVDPYLEAALRLMQSVRNGSIMRCLAAIEGPLIRIYRERDDRHFVIACYTYAHYADDVDIDKLHDTFEEIQQPELHHAAMNAAEQLIQRGLIRGRQEGHQEGHQKGRKEDILGILEFRFKRVPEGLAEVIHSIRDGAKLGLLFHAALQCESLDDFAKEL